MAESNPTTTPNISPDNHHHHHHHKETHGLRKDIDENSKMDDVKGPNIFERAKEEFEAIAEAFHQPNKESHKGQSRDIDVKSEANVGKKDIRLDRETHGKRRDIDEKTSVNEIKSPNVFERAKEEIEALVHTIHPNKDSKHEVSPKTSKTRDEDKKSELKLGKMDTHSDEKKPKSPSLLVRAKEEIENIFHKEKSPHRHHKETHGMSADFDANTSIDDIKGPNVFVRAKEEFEAIVEAIHPKKESPKKLK